MKIRIEMSVEVDMANWSQVYGAEGAADIRQDVKSYILNAIQQSAAADEDAITSVEIKGF